MDGMLQKWLFILILIPILILLFFSRVEGLQRQQIEIPSVESGSCYLFLGERAGNGIIVRKVDVFHNRKGLKDDINVVKPLRELNALAKSDSDSIEELIKDITVWLPKVYYEQFLVYPECIIILETKINDQGRAEVRFGVAMQCSYKARLANPITI